MVIQQYEVLKLHTSLNVSHYVGEMNVDIWKHENWKDELHKTQLLVMTPQILYNMLLHGFFSLTDANLIIFDECHHATKDHPYNRIMKQYYHNISSHFHHPKIFGMTASPIMSLNLKDDKEACQRKLKQLEVNLNSIVCTGHIKIHKKN